MKLRGGFSVCRRSRNCPRLAREPSASMKTPWLELLTHPARPSSAARRCTKGRKPTPCTAPRTAIFKRVVGGAFKQVIRMEPVPKAGVLQLLFRLRLLFTCLVIDRFSVTFFHFKPLLKRV